MKILILLGLLLLSPIIQERRLPTEKLQKAITYFENDYSTIVTKCAMDDEYKGFVRTSIKGAWTYGGSELKADVWRITLKGKKQIEPNTYARVTITEFQFSTAAKAAEAKTIIDEFSKEQWKMKNMNNYFIHDSCIYMIETDAVMFEDDYNSITSRLKKYLEA